MLSIIKISFEFNGGNHGESLQNLGETNSGIRQSVVETTPERRQNSEWKCSAKGNQINSKLMQIGCLLHRGTEENVYKILKCVDKTRRRHAFHVILIVSDNL